jgi:hypothetical protein
MSRLSSPASSAALSREWADEESNLAVSRVCRALFQLSYLPIVSKRSLAPV